MYNFKFLKESNFPVTSDTFDKMQTTYQQVAKVLSKFFGNSYVWLTKPTASADGVLLANGVIHRVDKGNPTSDKYKKETRQTPLTLEDGSQSDLIEETYYKKDATGSDLPKATEIKNFFPIFTAIHIDGSKVQTTDSTDGLKIHGYLDNGTTVNSKKSHSIISGNNRSVVYEIKPTLGVFVPSTDVLVQCTINSKTSSGMISYTHETILLSERIVVTVDYTSTAQKDFDIAVNVTGFNHI